ncbi:MAG: 5-formyltetrahydrofolate cyclo-ligase [Candidatus Hadarchaeum sp.]
MDKQFLREKIWRELEASGAAAFPKPIRGRIPNFVGSSEAARRLGSLPAYLSAKSIFVNPDAAQLAVREMALRGGKQLLMATPRLRHGFVLIDPAKVVDFRQAASIGGAFRHGRKVSPRGLKVDLVVEGSVAVDRMGGRVGKGGGYGDLEFAILRELGAATEETPVVTTVHPLQIVARVPMEAHDVPVDYIVTPDQIIKTSRHYPRPSGIDWDLLPADALKQIPLLAELRKEHDHGCR